MMNSSSDSSSSSSSSDSSSSSSSSSSSRSSSSSSNVCMYACMQIVRKRRLSKTNYQHHLRSVKGRWWPADIR